MYNVYIYQSSCAGDWTFSITRTCCHYFYTRRPATVISSSPPKSKHFSRSQAEIYSYARTNLTYTCAYVFLFKQLDFCTATEFVGNSAVIEADKILRHAYTRHFYNFAISCSSGAEPDHRFDVLRPSTSGCTCGIHGCITHSGARCIKYSSLLPLFPPPPPLLARGGERRQRPISGHANCLKLLISPQERDAYLDPGAARGSSLALKTPRNIAT